MILSGKTSATFHKTSNQSTPPATITKTSPASRTSEEAEITSTRTTFTKTPLPFTMTLRPIHTDSNRFRSIQTEPENLGYLWYCYSYYSYLQVIKNPWFFEKTWPNLLKIPRLRICIGANLFSKQNKFGLLVLLLYDWNSGTVIMVWIVGTIEN